MDESIRLELHGLRFAWDDEKAIRNWEKHRVTFNLAAEVFFDAYALDRPDRWHMQEEPRRKVIGMTFDSLKTLLVVYVERESWDGNDVIRMISARPATGKERRDYEAGISK
ncbi:MAG: BrnT family toxin [Synergistaceae bacterium]|nr:BrnT family toxin [Synergistaceae bacterium]